MIPLPSHQWGPSPLPPQHAAAAIDGDGRRAAARANAGYYGTRRLSDRERLTPADEASIDAGDGHPPAIDAPLPAGWIDEIVDTAAADLLRIAPREAIRVHLATCRPPEIDADASGGEDGIVYSLLTAIGAPGPTEDRDPSRRFAGCIASVAALIAADMAATGARRIEWVIVADAPARARDEIASRLPDDLLGSVRIVARDGGRGEADGLTQAARAARGTWMVPLGGGDAIEADATRVLDHYRATVPTARHVTCGQSEIDEAGRVLRRRRHADDPTRLFESNPFIGRHIAMRRDLFLRLGGYRSAFDGCHQLSMALRVAFEEPLLVIPEYLYRVRGRRVPVAPRKAKRRWWRIRLKRRRPGPTEVPPSGPRSRHVDVLRSTLGVIAECCAPSVTTDAAALLPIGLGYAVVATRGGRMDRLEQTLDSIARQSPALSPLVVIQGDDATRDRVHAELAARGLADALLVAPGHEGATRSAAWNVGLDRLRFSAAENAFVVCLDEGDVVYPFFAERMARLLDLTGGDVAMAGACTRGDTGPARPGPKPLPISALMTGAGTAEAEAAFVVRTGFLRASGVRWRDDLVDFADRDILLALVGAGARVRQIDDVLLERRVVPDEAAPIDAERRRDDAERVDLRGAWVAKQLAIAGLCRDLAAFDFAAHGPLAPGDIGRLIAARTLMAEE